MRIEVQETGPWNFSFRKKISRVLLNGIQRKMTRSTDTSEENAWNVFPSPLTTFGQKQYRTFLRKVGKSLSIGNMINQIL